LNAVFFAFAYLGVLFVSLIFFSAYEVSLKFVIYRGFRKLMEKCTRPEKVPLVLKDGETIVAVGETIKGMSFYIKNNNDENG
jgi:hypothetical protein